MSKKDPHYASKLIHVWGEEGSEKPKNRSTWFVDDPLQNVDQESRKYLDWQRHSIYLADRMNIIKYGAYCIVNT